MLMFDLRMCARVCVCVRMCAYVCVCVRVLAGGMRMNTYE